MVLAVNVGNSRISVGLFAKETGALQFQCRLATDPDKTSDEYLCLLRMMLREAGFSAPMIGGAIASSVVPQLTATVREVLLRLTGKEPLMVGPGMKTGFSIKIDAPSELGGDMVANTAAVLQTVGQKRAPIVIADLGTVTTVSAINEKREYVGCCIVPGIGISFESLHGKTAQLPNVMRSAPGRAIGKNSQDAVRSGVIYGHAMMLDGFVQRFAREMRSSAEELVTVMTGEYADAVVQVCKHPFVWDENLTLKGLYALYCQAMQGPKAETYRHLPL